MHHNAFRSALMFVPIAVAVLAALAVPSGLQPVAVLDDGGAGLQAYARCRAQSAPTRAAAPASVQALGPRTQSPAWLQQREAALIHCLQAELATARQASAR